MGTSDWVELASGIATCLAFIAGVIGVFFLTKQIQGARAAINADICWRFFDLWHRMRDKRLLVNEKFIRPRVTTFEGFNKFDKEIQGAMWETCDFWEYMGYFEKFGGIDIKVIREFWGEILIDYWETFEDVIKHVRDQDKRPLLYEHLERLYDECKKDPIFRKSKRYPKYIFVF